MRIHLPGGRKIELIKIIKGILFIRSQCWYSSGFKLNSRTKLLINYNIKVETSKIQFPIEMLKYEFLKRINLETFCFKIAQNQHFKSPVFSRRLNILQVWLISGTIFCPWTHLLMDLISHWCLTLRIQNLKITPGNFHFIWHKIARTCP